MGTLISVLSNGCPSILLTEFVHEIELCSFINKFCVWCLWRVCGVWCVSVCAVCGVCVWCVYVCGVCMWCVM